jgi:hypothetical protein
MNEAFPLGSYPHKGTDTEKLNWIDGMFKMSKDESVNTSRRKLTNLHAIHYKLVYLIEQRDNNSIISYIQELTRDSDINEIRTMLVIMKAWKNDPIFKTDLDLAVERIESITGKKLL